MKTITVRVKDDLYNILRLAAAARDTSLNDVVCDTLDRAWAAQKALVEHGPGYQAMLQELTK